MDPSDKKPPRFYSNFKVHKDHIEGTAPPVRPTGSGSGSVMEACGAFVEHHIKAIHYDAI